MRGIEHIPWLYDFFMEAAERTGLASWRQALVRLARGRTLDLGCGTGRNLPRFSRSTELVGLELDLRLLSRARRRAPAVPMVVARAEELPFRAAAFDTVVSSLVFCSVQRPDEGLREIRRVLDPSGRLGMLEHVRAENGSIGRVQDLIQPLWTWVAGGCHPNRRTEASVVAAGFVIERHELRGRTTLRCFVARPR